MRYEDYFIHVRDGTDLDFWQPSLQKLLIICSTSLVRSRWTKNRSGTNSASDICLPIHDQRRIVRDLLITERSTTAYRRYSLVVPVSKNERRTVPLFWSRKAIIESQCYTKFYPLNRLTSVKTDDLHAIL